MGAYHEADAGGGYPILTRWRYSFSPAAQSPELPARAPALRVVRRHRAWVSWPMRCLV